MQDLFMAVYYSTIQELHTCVHHKRIHLQFPLNDGVKWYKQPVCVGDVFVRVGRASGRANCRHKEEVVATEAANSS